jgi:hypothetical protein
MKLKVSVNSVCKPALEMKCLPAEGQDRISCAFDWEMDYDTKTSSLQIKYKWKDMRKVSTALEYDYMSIELWGAFLFKDSADKSIFEGV